MSFTAPEDTFLDVKDANLRVYGNVHADGLKLGQLEVVTTTSTGSTIQFLHQHTALTTTSNIEVGTTNHDLFVDTSTSRVGILTNTPTATLDVNGVIKGSFLDVVGDINFTGNLTQGGSSYILPVGGTGSLTVPSGDTGQRPVPAVNGMLRYNSTIGFMEAYTAAGWAPIAQPPTVTGISPLSTFTSGGTTFGWNKHQDLIHSNALAGDQFGTVIGMSSDGNYAAISAIDDMGGGIRSGTVTMFKRNTATNQWTQIQHENIPSGAATDDKFGSAISLSSDGQALVIGAGFAQQGGQDQAGMVSTWRFNGTTYSYVSGITNPRGNTSGAVWGGVDTARGTSMAGNGLNMVVGQYNYNSYRGIVDVYSRAAITDNWTYYGTITPPNSVGGVVRQYFGYTVEMSLDGKVVVIGASLTTNTVNREGLVYVYEYSGSADGVYSGGSWTLRTTLISPSPANDGNFGSSVGISQDANYVFVGEPRAPVVDHNGNAHIYVRSLNSWVFQQTLVDPDSSAGDLLGVSAGLRLSSDGTHALLGVHNDTGEGNLGSEIGKVLYFKRTNATWAYVQTIYHHSPTVGDNFGGASSVAISGDGTRALIGARLDDTPHNNSGHAFYYDFSDTTIIDVSTQVFTATGTGIVSGSTVQLEGADGTLYNVVDATPPNAAGTQVTFKMGTLGASGAFTIANQPYKVKVSSTSGLTGTSTAAIGFPVGWTSPAADATLNFNISGTSTHTLVGTDGGGGTNRTFSISPLSAVQALPSGLQPVTAGGVINGQIAADQLNITTPVTFRLTDNGSGQFEDRVIKIVGVSDLYVFSPNPFTFTNAGVTGRTGPTLTDLTNGSDAYSPGWTGYTSNLNVTAGIQEWTVPTSGTYQITAAGAASSGGSTGAIMRGDFNLTRGEIIKILVGQKSIVGLSSSYHYGDTVGAGGGGGTFVIRTPYDSTGSILVIAGGGGGTTWTSDGSPNTTGRHGTTSNNGQDAETTNSGDTGAGGTSGSGGLNLVASGLSGGYAPGGGGGFSGDGLPSYSGYSYPQTAALSFTNGGTGGADAGTYSRGDGGFGGGAAASYGGGAGGGGYSGGGGVSSTGSGVDSPKNGGGGGSYNSGTNQSNSAGASSGNSGHGSVIITKI